MEMLFLDEMLSIIDKSGGFSGDQVKVLNLVIFETRVDLFPESIEATAIFL